MNSNPYEDLLKIGVKENQISQFLYKYRTIDSAKQLLENNSLWFSSPKDFNDPFDCQIVPNTNNTESEIKDYIRNAQAKLSGEQLSEDRINAIASEAFNTPGKWQKIIESTFDVIVNRNGICCFTKNEKNLLMWSHYTYSHKGLCLKFDILKDPNFFAVPVPVNYRDDYPNYNHLGNRESLVSDIILSKSKDWAYEDEVRVIKLNQKGLIAFNKEALTEIIFGCNAEDKDVNEIIELANKNNFDIKFKKAAKQDRKFGLDIMDL